MRDEWMRILTDDGVIYIGVRSDEAASLIGSYWNAVRNYLYTGDTSRLDELQGARINRHRLLTDPDTIDEWVRRGDLDLDSIYADGSE